MSEELVWMTASELVERYRSRAVSPVEAVAAHLARIDRLDRRLNAYITVTADRARAQAQQAERRYGGNTSLAPRRRALRTQGHQYGLSYVE